LKEAKNVAAKTDTLQLILLEVKSDRNQLTAPIIILKMSQR